MTTAFGTPFFVTTTRSDSRPTLPTIAENWLRASFRDNVLVMDDNSFSSSVHNYAFLRKPDPARQLTGRREGETF
jgi:hypothetical protein